MLNPPINIIIGNRIENKEAGFLMIDKELLHKLFIANINKAELVLILFLLSNAGDGSYKLVEQTVLDFTGLSKQQYLRARQGLVEKGWIEHIKHESITVYIDIIKETLEPREKKIEILHDLGYFDEEKLNQINGGF